MSIQILMLVYYTMIVTQLTAEKISARNSLDFEQKFPNT